MQVAVVAVATAFWVQVLVGREVEELVIAYMIIFREIRERMVLAVAGDADAV